MPVRVKVVEANSVADYLERYYKRDRLEASKRAYGQEALQRKYELNLALDGYVNTNSHDNVTGVSIYWPKFPPDLGPNTEIET